MDQDLQNDDLPGLEAELEALEPAPLSEEFTAKISGIFDGASVKAEPGNVVRFPVLQRLGAAAAIAIAAVGVTFAILNNLPKGQGGGSGEIADRAALEKTFVPVAAENIFEGVRNEGMTLTGDNRPVQKLRYQFSDSYQWVNPSDGSTIEMTVPRERIILVPVPTD